MDGSLLCRVLEGVRFEVSLTSRLTRDELSRPCLGLVRGDIRRHHCWGERSGIHP